ncbi:MAG: class I SAM-dependent methyltransferase [Chlamydiota bacterium]
MQNSSAVFQENATFFWQSVRVFTQCLWKSFLQKNMQVIDATCGRGKDTLFLAKKVPLGRVYAYDIQEKAISETKERITREGLEKRVSFFQKSHTHFLQTADLVVYNLGYLPGSDKRICTRGKDVLISVQEAMKFAKALSITCYPGHEEGAEEERLIGRYCQTLSPKEWTVSHHTWPNRTLCPSLFWITKTPGLDRVRPS